MIKINTRTKRVFYFSIKRLDVMIFVQVAYIPHFKPQINTKMCNYGRQLKVSTKYSMQVLQDTRPCLLSVVLCTQKCPCATRVWKLDLAATQNRRIIPLPSLLCLSPLPRLMDALNSSKRMLQSLISDQKPSY